MAAEWKETLETEREISAFMLELGIPAHLRGYYYLRGGGFCWLSRIWNWLAA